MTVTSGIRCVPDMARFWSAKTPDKAALIDTDRVVTYAQLDDRSNRIANTLTAAGIRPGSHVGYLGKNSPAFFEIWTGAHKAACALAPLNWHNAAELTEIVHEAMVPLIFAGREFIAGYKVPKEIHLTDALPQTASGKVQKAALRQQLQASPQPRI